MKAIIISIIAGILSVLFGYVSNFIVEKTHLSRVPPECADWNKDHIMEKSLFINGFMVSIFMLYAVSFVMKRYFLQ